MITRSHKTIIANVFIAGLSSLFFAAACTPQIGAPPIPGIPAEEVTATEELVGTTTPAPATAEAQPEEIVSPTPEATEPVRLTLWTIEAVSPQAEGEPGQIFGNGLKAFQSTYPDVPVSVVLKNESGEGSVLDYLRSASQAAPSILPDVVVLDTVDLAQVARAGLVVPLDSLISASLVDDLVPAAREAGTIDGQLVAIPFEMDVEHLVYNTNKLESPPMVWTDVISADTTYVFPAKGVNGLVNDAFLIQYFALGGSLQDEEGQPYLNEQALITTLGYYQQGLEAGVIPPEVLNFGTPEDIWPSYVSAEVGMTHVTSHRFVNDRSVLRSTEFATIPTYDGTSLTIGRGRTLAIVTRDANRQAMAARLIEWLMAPDNNTAWNRAAAYLPTRYAAFKSIGDSDPYWPFLEHQLEIAVPPPAFPEYDQIARVLQQAVIEVLSEEATPEEAASAAIDAITP